MLLTPVWQDKQTTRTVIPWDGHILHIYQEQLGAVDKYKTQWFYKTITTKSYPVKYFNIFIS